MDVMAQIANGTLEEHDKWTQLGFILGGERNCRRIHKVSVFLEAGRWDLYGWIGADSGRRAHGLYRVAQQLCYKRVLRRRGARHRCLGIPLRIPRLPTFVRHTPILHLIVLAARPYLTPSQRPPACFIPSRISYLHRYTVNFDAVAGSQLQLEHRCSGP
eukprot:1309935-Rhodomonas_salina.1